MNTSKFLLVVFLGCFFVLVPLVHAQDISPTPKPVEYTLAHPGMLPGNPFYSVKEVRDFLTSFFTSRPLKKADFALLQSDKYAQAAYLLASEKKDIRIVVFALTRSEEYFQEALTHAALAKKEGLDTKDLSKRFRLANLKHQEVVAKVAGIVPEKEKAQIAKEQATIQAFSKKIQK